MKEEATVLKLKKTFQYIAFLQVIREPGKQQLHVCLGKYLRQWGY